MRLGVSGARWSTACSCRATWRSTAGRSSRSGSSGAAGGIAAPGFVDLQVNGFAGVDLMAADFEGLRARRGGAAGDGDDGLSADVRDRAGDVLLDALRAMPVDGIGARVLGAHLEGPFLSPRRAGVHDAESSLGAGSGAAAPLLDAAPVSQVTLAPELPGPSS